jgi:DNA-binding GntR family transcriptional regulator
MEAYSRFRSQWLGAVPNRRLADTISRFVDHVQTVRILTLAEPETQRIALSLLTELLEGFRSRDALRVYDSMIRFVDRAEERFLLRVAADPNQIFGSE